MTQHISIFYIPCGSSSTLECITSEKWQVHGDKWQMTSDKGQVAIFFIIMSYIFGFLVNPGVHQSLQHVKSDKWQMTSDKW